MARRPRGTSCCFAPKQQQPAAAVMALCKLGTTCSFKTIEDLKFLRAANMPMGDGPGPSSHSTRRWRKVDSNPRSRSRKLRRAEACRLTNASARNCWRTTRPFLSRKTQAPRRAVLPFFVYASSLSKRSGSQASKGRQSCTEARSHSALGSAPSLIVRGEVPERRMGSLGRNWPVHPPRRKIAGHVTQFTRFRGRPSDLGLTPACARGALECFGASCS